MSKPIIKLDKNGTFHFQIMLNIENSLPLYVPVSFCWGNFESLSRQKGLELIAASAINTLLKAVQVEKYSHCTTCRCYNE